MKRGSCIIALLVLLVTLAAAGFAYAEEMTLTVLHENDIEYKGHSTLYTTQALPKAILEYVKENNITLTTVEVSAFAESL